MSQGDRRPGQGEDEGEQGTTRKVLLAVLLAWLVPGLGHVMLGRVRRGILFAVLIFLSFGLGLAHDGKLAFRDGQQPFLSTLQTVANVGVGAVDPVARWFVYGEPAYTITRDRPDPSAGARLEILRDRTRSGVSIYGTAYLWTAGLMNLLLLFDVWDIGRKRKA